MGLMVIELFLALKRKASDRTPSNYYRKSALRPHE